MVREDVNEKTISVLESTNKKASRDTSFIVSIFDGKNISNYDLKKFEKEKITFGRLEDNDIVISSNLMSGHHGYFELKKDKCRIIDNNSKNKLFINNIETESKYLDDNDIIRVDNLERPLDSGILMLFSTKKLKNDSSWKAVRLTEEDLIIGRDKASNLRVDHPTVSRKHIKISYENGKYYIENYSGVNPVTINNEQLDSKKALKEKDVILLTVCKFLFVANTIIYKIDTNGINLIAKKITKTVKIKNGKKNIVNDVSLKIEGGEFVAIVGGSGAGKSSVMNCLSGYTAITSGQVLLNNEDLFANFSALKESIGFVPQQDIVHNDLILKDLLYYAANLRMPSDTDKAEKEKRIKEVIKMVELTGKENTFIRRLSGGEKKRASIAIELLSDPGLFFLDEPTSGLDPGTERNLMITLKKLSEMGKTIIMVTHTPLNLHLCDKIIFMGRGGNLCFSGTPEDSLEFFEVDNFVDIYNLVNNNSEHFKTKFESINDVDTAGSYAVEKIESKNKKSGFSQFINLTKRYFNLIKNNKIQLAFLLLQAPIVVFLISFVISDTLFQSYEKTRSILFALVFSSIWLGILNAIQEICKELPILKREFLAGVKVKSYVFSKLAILGVICFIQSLLLMVTFALLANMPDKGLIMGTAFFEMLITAFLVSFSSSTIGLFISAIVPNTEVAMTSVPLLLIPQLIFSGILFELSGITKTISTAIFSRWGMEAYGTIANLNSLPMDLSLIYPQIIKETETFYNYTISHLQLAWLNLLILSTVFVVLTILILNKKLKAK